LVKARELDQSGVAAAPADDAWSTSVSARNSALAWVKAERRDMATSPISAGETAAALGMLALRSDDGESARE
jgi:hypothetical protein